MNLPFQIVIESFFGFLALFVLTKVIGKTQISQLTAFDFISALILGELVGNAIYDDKIGIRHVALAILLWGALLYIIEIITQKYKGTRSLLEGRPAILIHQGLLQREEMKKNKVDINQLLHSLRSKGAFSIREVAYAILETDGSISVLKKTLDQTPTRKDLNLLANKVVLPITIINDGEIINDNLDAINQDEHWLKEELKKQNYSSVKDIYYAEYKEGEALFVQPF